MTEQEIIAKLKEIGALKTGGHFVLTSGRHSGEYVAKDLIYARPGVTSLIGLLIAQQFINDVVEVVVGPALGGIVLSQWVTYQLNTMTRGCEILSVYAEKIDGRFAIRRGYEALIPDKRVLVVEDILTTGGSVLGVSQAVQELGSQVVGVGAIWNRGRITAQDIDGAPKFFSLINQGLDSWLAVDCELCRAGVPIDQTIGKGAQFVAR